MQCEDELKVKVLHRQKHKKKTIYCKKGYPDVLGIHRKPVGKHSDVMDILRKYDGKRDRLELDEHNVGISQRHSASQMKDKDLAGL